MSQLNPCEVLKGLYLNNFVMTVVESDAGVTGLVFNMDPVLSAHN